MLKLLKMKLIFVLLVVVFCFLCLSESAPKRKKLWYSSAQLKKARKRKNKVLLGPNGETLSLSGLQGYNRPLSLTQGTATGISSNVRFVVSNRPQVVDANFGPDPVAPRRVPKKKVIRPRKLKKPNARRSRTSPQPLQQMSDKQKRQVAQNFFVTANYSSNSLSDGSDLIRRMQHNYGLNETGELDDRTLYYMMAPRCGFPDQPANYMTFQGNPRWNHNPVTYKFAGYTPDMSPCQVRNALKRAFRVWEEVIELDFEETRGDTADIIIYFGYREHGDGYPFDDKNGLLAHAFTAGTHDISGDTHFDDAEFWTLGNGQVEETYYGNANGAPCHFPFIYKNKEYSACTKDGQVDGHEWCATTRNYDQDGQYGLCPDEKLFTYGGNSDGNPCKFPFIFEGKSYDACTYEGRSDGYKWCATTASYDDDSMWGFCPDRAHATYGGNSDGASCSFPFIFNGNRYDECTVVGRTDFLPWCATTPNYDDDGKFGFCNGEGYNLFFVAAHEFGHVIGLDHSNNQDALMYPSYQNFENFRLPDDDRRGALSLYEPRRTQLKPLNLETCGGNLAATDGNPSPPGGTPVSTSRPTSTPRPTRTTTELSSLDPQQDPLCGGKPINAMTVLGPEIYVYKGKYQYRMTDPKGSKTRNLISSQFRGFPSSTSVNAIYRRPQDNSVVIFSGLRHWIFDGRNLRDGYPKSASILGLSLEGDKRVNAALNWKRSKNRRKTYFFVGNKYYRYDEIRERMDANYPKPISVWRGVERNVNAAMDDPNSDRQSLFAQGDTIDVLHNYRVEVTRRVPVDVFFGCRQETAAAVPLQESRRRRDRKNP